jgi:hypothetical protein
MQKPLTVIVRRRRSHCRYLGCYAIFRSGVFLTVRLFALPSGQYIHICGSQVFHSPSFAPPL